ncbi:MAG: GPR endopeptidase [Clostridia bacterium]|nr:GPR endopeptidase [Clostridia bacterium]
MNIRTDIALERYDLLPEKHRKGVKVDKWKRKNVEITKVEITDKEGEQAIGKPMGKYFTVELPEFSHESEIVDIRLEIITKIIKDLIPNNAKTFLVAGIGNENITPDALGPLCAEKIFPTRHFENFTEIQQYLPSLNPVSSISTGVLGQTGIETAEYITGIVNLVKPDLVIMIDALASSDLSALGRTVQLSDTGISPGAGVGNYRKRIDKTTLGVPVVSIGVPTVTDFQYNDSMIVTPKDIDMIISRASSFLSLAINCAIQPNMDAETFLALS